METQRSVPISGLVGGLGKPSWSRCCLCREVGGSDWLGKRGEGWVVHTVGTEYERWEKSQCIWKSGLLAIVQIWVPLRCLCLHACVLSRVQLSAIPQRLFVPPGKFKLVVRDANEALGRHSVHSCLYILASRKSLSMPIECVCVLSHFSRVWLFLTCQAPLSMGFPRQECWSGLPCPPPGDLSDPGTEPVSVMSPALAGGFFTTSILGNPSMAIITSKFLSHLLILFVFYSLPFYGR